MKAILVIDVKQDELDLLDEYKKQNMIVDIGYYYDEIQGWSFTRKKLSSIKSMPMYLETPYLFRQMQIASGLQNSDGSVPVYTEDYQEGWNDCIDAILEEEE